MTASSRRGYSPSGPRGYPIGARDPLPNAQERPISVASMEMTSVSARPRTVPPRRVTDAPTASGGARDLFLDTVRAVAIIRVVTWHAYGWAPITWVVSAVPAMIFV